MVFVEVPADNGGRELTVDWYVPSGETLPAAPHYHAGPGGEVAETFTIISGTATLKVGGRKHTVVAPASIDIGFNEVHTHPANAGDGELHVRQSGIRAQPEPEMLGRVEQFLETLVALSQQGKVTRKGDIRNPLQAAVTINDLLLNPTFLPMLPASTQRFIFKAIAKVARRRGYRPYHRPQPLGPVDLVAGITQADRSS